MIKSLIGEEIHLLEKTTIVGELRYDGDGYSVSGCVFTPEKVKRIVIGNMPMYVPIVVLKQG